MWRSLAPTLATGGEAIISSTPNGDTDLFATLWRGAKLNQGAEIAPDARPVVKSDNGNLMTAANLFVPLYYPWNLHPERDEQYLRDMQGELGPIGFRQEVLCVAGDTDITVRNKLTGKIQTLTMREFTERLAA